MTYIIDISRILVRERACNRGQWQLLDLQARSFRMSFPGFWGNAPPGNFELYNGRNGKLDPNEIYKWTKRGRVKSYVAASSAWGMVTKFISWRAGHEGSPDTEWVTTKSSKTFRRLRHFQFVNWTLDRNFLDIRVWSLSVWCTSCLASLKEGWSNPMDFRRVKDFLELIGIVISWRVGHKGFPDTTFIACPVTLVLELRPVNTHANHTSLNRQEKKNV